MGQKNTRPISLCECILYIRRMIILPIEIQQIIINLLKSLCELICRYEDLNNILLSNNDLNIWSREKHNKLLDTYYIGNWHYVGEEDIPGFIFLSEMHNKLIMGHNEIRKSYYKIDGKEYGIDMDEINTIKNVFMWDLTNFTLFNKKTISDMSKIPKDFIFTWTLLFRNNPVPIQIVDNKGYPRIITITNDNFDPPEDPNLQMIKHIYNTSIIKYVA